MRKMWTPLMVALTFLTVAFAGCADGPTGTDPTDDTNVGDVDATSTTGGIRGVVVDQSIVPIQGVQVCVLNTELCKETDESGAFLFSGLQPGSYFVKASHPLYGEQQTSAEVQADVEKPPVLKIQMTRLSTIDPFYETVPFKGYISCSTNVVVPGIGGVLMEECGEGVGYPCQAPPTIYQCNDRVGKAADNKAQIDFWLSSEEEKTIIAEAVWEPSVNLGVSQTGQQGGFNMGIYVNFGCDPWCGWDQQIDRANGHSPLYLRSDTNEEGDFDGDVVLADAGITPETRLSTFTWASSDETGALLEQDYEVFVTSSFVLELPEAWSFVNNDPAPF